MIHIYTAENAPTSRTDYKNNGDCILTPTSCEYNTSTRTLTLEHPVDDEGRYKYITESAVIKAPSYNGEQLFRIYNTEKTETDVIAEARPIFYDAKSVYLFDNRPTNKTGQQAIDWILSGTIYSGRSDISKTSTAYYMNQNVIEALMGDDSTAFINRWGGEVEFNNFTVSINQRNGSDSGAIVSYGNNITSIRETINTEDVIYHIRPQSFNGYTLPNNELVSAVKSFPVIGKTVLRKYEDIKLKADLYDGEDITDITVCETMDDVYTALRERAKAEFTDDKINEVQTTIKINLETLRNNPEYINYSGLESISLGDSVTLRHPLFDDIDARVNSLKYDCLAEITSEITIGNAEYNYIKDTAAKETKIYNVVNSSTGQITTTNVTSDTYATIDENGSTVYGISGKGNGVKYIAFENGLITQYEEGSTDSSQIKWGTEDASTALADADDGTVYIQV